MPNPPRTRFARSDDVDLAYQVYGDGPRNILAVAGWVSHLEVMWELAEFARFLDRLGTMGRVVIYDKRGTGMSDRPGGDATLEDHANDVRTVLDAAGMDHICPIGWVDGVGVIANFAASWPERVDALVLGSFLPTPSVTVNPEFAAEFAHAVEHAWGEAAMVPTMVPSVVDDARVLEWFRRYERLSATPNAAAAMQQWALSLDLDAILPAIQAPTLVLHRRDVATVPADEVRRAAAMIPNARYVELPGADLYPIFGDADAVLAEIEEFLTGTRTAAHTDRVLATVLFTDIVDSTDRARTLGDRAWSDLLDAHHAEVRRVLAQSGGHEVKTTGDGFLATFDGPARGIRAAVTMVESIRELGLEIRAGLHTGEIERGPDDISGIAVHVGARVAALAGPSEVLVTSTVRDLVLGSSITFADRGRHPLKGVPGEWQLFAVEQT